MAYIQNFNNDTIVTGTSDTDHIYNYASYVTIDAGDGSNAIFNIGGSYVSIKAESGNDVIISTQTTTDTKVENVTIDAGDGDNQIVSTALSATIITGNGNDSVFSSPTRYNTEFESDNDADGFISISTGNGNDFISGLNTDASSTLNGYYYGETYNVTANYKVQPTMIDAGAGDDTIYSGGTIKAGTGNDYIGIWTYDSDMYTNTSTVSDTGTVDYSLLFGDRTPTTILYSDGDGNDTVVGYGASDSVVIESTQQASSLTSGDDLLVNIGAGSIRFIGMADSLVNLVDTAGNSISVSASDSDTTPAAITPTVVRVDLSLAQNATTGVFVVEYTDSGAISTGVFKTTATASDYVVGSVTAANVYVAVSNEDSVRQIIRHSEMHEWNITATDYDNTILSNYNNTYGRNTIYSGEGQNYVSIMSGYNLIITGNGDDTISLYYADNTINAGSGANFINVVNDFNVITTGDGDDTIFGSEYDTIDAGAGANFISIDGYGDIITTGDGDDTILSGQYPGYIRINAGAGANYVSVSSGNNRITAGDGSDTVFSSYGNNTIDAGAGANFVSLNNIYGGNSIISESGNDTIFASGTINAGAGNDSINIYSADIASTILYYSDGDGNDTVNGYTISDTVIIESTQQASSLTSGNDLLVNIGAGSIRFIGMANSLVNLVDPAGNSISVSDSGSDTTPAAVTPTVVSIDLSLAQNATTGVFVVEYTDSGATSTGVFKTTAEASDYVVGSVTAANVYVAVSNEDSVRQIITNDTNGWNITATSYDDSITNGGDESTINTGDGNDYINNGHIGYDGTTLSNSIINVGDGNNTINNQYATQVTINAGIGNDSISNYSGSNITINSGAGNDSIENYNNNRYVFIDAGDDNDIINNAGQYVTINAGNGDDTIINTGTNITVNTGQGNDSINSIGLMTIKYNDGDGHDTVMGYLTADTVIIDSAQHMSSVNSGNDLLVNIGDGSIRFIGMANSLVNLVDTAGNSISIGDSDTTPDDTIPAVVTPTAVNVNLNNATTESGIFIAERTETPPVAMFIPGDIFQYNGNLYNIFYVSKTDAQADDSVTWEAAKAHCESLGGHLAVISDDAENTAVYNYMTTTGEYSAFFGLSDAGSEGTWTWVTGAEVSYTNWEANEPNGGEDEGYGMFYYGVSDEDRFPAYYWNDGRFGATNAFICEWEADDIIVAGSVTSANVYVANSNDSVKQAITVPSDWNVTATDYDDAINITGDNVSVASGSGNDSVSVASSINNVTIADLDISADKLIFATDIPEHSLVQSSDNGQIKFTSNNLNFTLQNMSGLTSDLLNFNVVNGNEEESIEKLLYTEIEPHNITEVRVNLNRVPDNETGVFVIESTNTSETPRAIFKTTAAENDYVVGTVSDGNVYVANSNEDSIRQFITIPGSWNVTTTDHGDKIHINGDNVTVLGGAGNDTITSSSNSSHVNIDAGDGDNKINIDGSYISVIAGDGNDIISNAANNVSIDSGDGDDSVVSWNDNVTINSAKGNDTVDLRWSTQKADVILYNNGDGHDTVIGYTDIDDVVIDYDREVVSEINGNDLIMNIGEGSITFIDGANLAQMINANVNLNEANSESGVFVVRKTATESGSFTINSDAEFMAGNFLSYNGNLYAIYSEVVDTWEDAATYCESLGGHLAVINDAAENIALYDFMTGMGYGSAYFGFSDADSEGDWKWVDGSPTNYTNWADGEPNSESDNEDYAQFYYKFNDGTWNDGNFNQGTVGDSKVFICEWESDDVIIAGSVTADKVYVAEDNDSIKQNITIPAAWNVTASDNDDTLNIVGNGATVAGSQGSDNFSVARGVDNVVIADLSTSADSLTFADDIPANSLSQNTDTAQLVLSSDDLTLTLQNASSITTALQNFNIENGNDTETIAELLYTPPVEITAVTVDLNLARNTTGIFVVETANTDVTPTATFKTSASESDYIVGTVNESNVYVANSNGDDVKQSIVIPAAWNVTASDNDDTLNIVGNSATVAGGSGNDNFSVARGVDNVVIADLSTSADSLTFADDIAENSLAQSVTDGQLTFASDDLTLTLQNASDVTADLLSFNVKNGNDTETVAELLYTSLSAEITAVTVDLNLAQNATGIFVVETANTDATPTATFKTSASDSDYIVGSVNESNVYVANSNGDDVKQNIIIPAAWNVTAGDNDDTLNIVGNNATVAGGSGSDNFSVASGVDNVVIADLSTSADSLTFADDIAENSLAQSVSDGQVTFASDDLTLTLQNASGVTADLLSFSVRNGTDTETIAQLLANEESSSSNTDATRTMKFAHWNYRFPTSRLAISADLINEDITISNDVTLDQISGASTPAFIPDSDYYDIQRDDTVPMMTFTNRQ